MIESVQRRVTGQLFKILYLRINVYEAKEL